MIPKDHGGRGIYPLSITGHFEARRSPIPPRPICVLLCSAIAASFLLATSLSQGESNLSGQWVFTHMNGRFQGTIALRQRGTDLAGTWHTSKGKSEPDTSVIGRVDGMTVVLTRFIVHSQQNYLLTLSADGNRLDGFGDGWFIKHANLNMQRATSGAAATQSSSASSAPASSALAATPMPAQKRAVPSTATPGKKQTWMGIGLPPPRGTYRWAIQSVVVGGGGSAKKYSSFYYEAATNRSLKEPLRLPRGGEIVGVFPDDCAFSVQDQGCHSFTFRKQDEAKARGLGPGTWSVYPLKCGGVAVFVK
jgi:hypothetical protein